MKTIDKESTSGKLLRAILIGVGVAVTMSNKYAMYKITKNFIKDVIKPKSKINIQKEIYRLRRMKLIEIKKEGNKHKLVLTENGEKICLRFNYENLKLKKPKIWDTKWRMVVFDIPQIKSNARDAFIRKLKDLGFVRFNNSVWIYPYQCQKEIDFVSNYWNIGRYIHFALVSDITNREVLIKHFKL